MLSHDNLLWNSGVFKELIVETLTHNFEDGRIVSYLPLSHIAGLGFDLIAQIVSGIELYYARPDVF